MATTYCTHGDVSNFLAISAFSGSTIPTSTTVEDRINEAEDYIELLTGRAWQSKTVSNEYHEIDLEYERMTGIPVFLNHRYVKTLASGSGDKLEIWDGSSWADWLTDSSRTEGRNNDYWLRYEDGVLYIKNWSRYPKGVRLTYRYGETTVPKSIKKAAILLTAIDLVSSDDRSVQLPEGTSQLDYAQKIEKWEQQTKKLLEPFIEFRISTK